MCLVRAALEYVDVVSSQCISSIVAWKYNMACQNMKVNMLWNTKCFQLIKVQSIYLQVKKVWVLQMMGYPKSGSI